MDSRKVEIIKSVKSGDVKRVSALLEEDSTLIKESGENGESLVLLAAYSRQDEVLTLLKKEKPSLDLYEAAVIGELSQVKKIIGENPHLVDSYSLDGFTPLGLASFFGKVAVIEFLLSQRAAVNIPSKNNFKVRPIHSAVASTNFEAIKVLLRAGADANARQMARVAPLHQAAHTGTIEIVKLLLKYGANPDAKTAEEKTPLDFALEREAFEIAAVLKEADRNTPTAC